LTRKQLGWFAALWAGSVLVLGVIAGVLRVLFKQML